MHTGLVKLSDRGGVLQVHGFPKVMGVLTHLDQFRNADALKRTKKTLKHRFWAEIYQGRPLCVAMSLGFAERWALFTALLPATAPTHGHRS